ncbi:hypothetical protein TURU_016829 [Turdus rufiventris]|nr:hypothetical protein TURU_016829 [Turdus rufiventris]
MKLRLQLKRGKALRQELERELSLARKEAQEQMDSAEVELRDVKNKLLELQVLNDKYRQKVAEIEKMFQSAQLQWEEERQKFAVERDNIRRVYLAEMEFLIEEKTQTEKACQDMNALLQNTLRKIRDMEVEHHGCSKILKLQANHLDFNDREKERLVRDLEMSPYEKEKMKLRLKLQRGEALRGVVQNERTFARKEAEVQMNSTEDELRDVKNKLLELQDSIQLPFVPQGISTPHGPAPDERMKAGEWTFAEADNFLQSKYGLSAAISEEEKIRFGGNQGTEKEVGDGLISSFFKAFQNPERKKTEEILPPCDPSYDNRKRWKGLIENATLSRDFTLEPVAMPVVRDAQGDRWEALDWKTITNLQKTVMQYGIENKLVRNQVTAIFKYTLLTPSDSKSTMKFILGPTSYMLWLNKGQAKLEEHMVENLDLPAGDPLRFTT